MYLAVVDILGQRVMSFFYEVTRRYEPFSAWCSNAGIGHRCNFSSLRHLSAFTSGFKFLRTAALLWLFNILVFALWYWDTDGGGPRKRHEANHKATDLMFPQQANGASWAPDFFDYIFVAFTAATAFSPTDTAPLTRLAKTLMMIEGVISLLIVAILISRVANIF